MAILLAAGELARAGGDDHSGVLGVAVADGSPSAASRAKPRPFDASLGDRQDLRKRGASDERARAGTGTPTPGTGRPLRMPSAMPGATFSDIERRLGFVEVGLSLARVHRHRALLGAFTIWSVVGTRRREAVGAAAGLVDSPRHRGVQANKDVCGAGMDPGLTADDPRCGNGGQWHEQCRQPGWAHRQVTFLRYIPTTPGEGGKKGRTKEEPHQVIAWLPATIDDLGASTSPTT
ncbi:MAG: hypothetical protein IPO18_09340 [bacterium]|nr:hypothetical protein [bacterium]